MATLLSLVPVLWILMAMDVGYSHTIKMNYHNEMQSIRINKDGRIEDVYFGDIVDIGNNRRIVYVGNGQWREKDDLKSTHWPAELHRYSAQDMSAWPQFIKTGFRILDNQLEQNQGFLDEAKGSAGASAVPPIVVEHRNYFGPKRVRFMVSMIFLGLSVLGVIGVLCFGIIVICGARKTTKAKVLEEDSVG